MPVPKCRRCPKLSLLPAVVAMLAVVAFLPADEKPAGPYATPEATWKTIRTANEKRDHKAFIGGFSAATQKRLAMRGALMGLQLRGDPDAAKKAASVLKVMDKHGLTAEATKGLTVRSRDDEEKVEAKLAALVKDPAGLYAEMSAALEKLPEMIRGGPLSEFQAGIRDVKVSGDKATAMVIFDDDERDDAGPTFTFIKVGREWRFAPDLGVKPPPEPVPGVTGLPKGAELFEGGELTVHVGTKVYMAVGPARLIKGFTATVDDKPLKVADADTITVTADGVKLKAFLLNTDKLGKFVMKAQPEFISDRRSPSPSRGSTLSVVAKGTPLPKPEPRTGPGRPPGRPPGPPPGPPPGKKESPPERR